MPAQIAHGIQKLIAQGDLPVGALLAERSLAERFQVSRSPVRQALKLLGDQGLITTRTDGGYCVSEVAAAHCVQLPVELKLDHVESIYLQLAQDRLDGQLGDKVTETELLRRYELTKAQLHTLLQRIVQEGWIERMPGHGWKFLPTFTSPDTYDQAYRFRILIEFAAFSEPGFCVDKDALRKCLAEQLKLIDGAVEWASPAQLFDANAHLHETIAAFSGNQFIVESLKRVNKLRRLMEYKKVVDRQAAARRCKEHKVLIELLLNDQIEAAADFLRLHLRDAAREKSGVLR